MNKDDGWVRSCWICWSTHYCWSCLPDVCVASRGQMSNCGNPFHDIPWIDGAYRLGEQLAWLVLATGFMHVYAPKCVIFMRKGMGMRMITNPLDFDGFWGTPCSDKPIRSISNTAAKRLGYWRLNPRSIPYSHICVGQIPFNYPKNHPTRQWHGKSLIYIM